MKLMSFFQCFNQLNWLAIIFISLIAGLIDYAIGAQKDKKIMLEFRNELKSLHDIEEILLIVKAKLDKWKF